MATTAHKEYEAPNIIVKHNPMSRINAMDTSRFIDNSKDKPTHLSRYFGGNRRNNHPYISGYWYFLIQPPQRLFEIGAGQSSNNQDQAVEWMLSTAESFTPPGKTLTFVDVPGMGGVNSSYVAGQELTQTFSVTFREYQEVPLFNLIQTWTSVIDPNTGTSPLAGDEYIPSNYKGTAYVALCKPTVGLRIDPAGSDSHLKSEDIEQLFFFDGVFPENTPLDLFDSDISTNDTKTISVNFSFDGFPLLKDTSGLINNFLTLMGNYNGINITTDNIRADSLNDLSKSNRNMAMTSNIDIFRG